MTWASDPKLRDGLHKPKYHEKGLLDMPYISGGRTYGTGFRHLPEAHELRGKVASATDVNKKECEGRPRRIAATLHAFDLVVVVRSCDIVATPFWIISITMILGCAVVGQES